MMWNTRRKRQFEQVRLEYGDALIRLTRSYTSDPSEQEDLQQDIAMALWKGLKQFKGECSLRTFVFRVAHNCSISKIIRNKKPQAHPIDVDERHKIPDPTPGADEQIIDTQDRERLQKAILALPVHYRQVLTLSLEELPHEEISSVLGISISNVGVRLNRARKMLKAKFGEETS